MFCVKCGAQLDDNAIFCPKCGNKVGEVSATASASPEVIVKSKRECIYDAVCRFLRATPQYLTGATFSDFEVYEEGQEGKIYSSLLKTDAFFLNPAVITRVLRISSILIAIFKFHFLVFYEHHSNFWFERFSLSFFTIQ